jgi:hypothetical protein
MVHTHQTAPSQFVEAHGIRFAYRRFGKAGGAAQTSPDSCASGPGALLNGQLGRSERLIVNIFASEHGSFDTQRA